MLLAQAGIQGLVRLFHVPEGCRRLSHEYAVFLHREETIRELIANRTLDEETQEKIFEALRPQIVKGE